MSEVQENETVAKPWSERRFWTTVAVVGFPIALVIILWTTYTWQLAVDDYGSRQVGIFGDSFAPIVGVLNTFALIFALVALRYQRLDLQETRKELRQQRLAQESQVKILDRANTLQEETNKIAQAESEERKAGRALEIIRKFNEPLIRNKIRDTQEAWAIANTDPGNPWELMKHNRMEASEVLNLFEEIAFQVINNLVDESTLRQEIAVSFISDFKILNSLAGAFMSDRKDNSLYRNVLALQSKWREEL